MSVKRSRIGSWMPRSLELIDEVLQVDGRGRVLVGVDGDVAELVDAEVALAPVPDAVGLDGVLDLPRGVEVGGVGQSAGRGSFPSKEPSAVRGRVCVSPNHGNHITLAARCNREGGKGSETAAADGMDYLSRRLHDMLRFHKFTDGRFAVTKFGSPDDPDDFEVLRTYVSLPQRPARAKYPATLVSMADTDDRMPPSKL